MADEQSRRMKDSGVEWIGEIPEGWSVVAVKHLCSMQAGKNLTAEQIEEVGKYPVYGGNGIRGYFEQFNCIGKALVIGRQGALCGNVHRVSGAYWATEHAVVTKAGKICNIDYLYYLLTGMNLNQYVSSTAAQPGLAVSTIQNLRTCLPLMEEQCHIAEFLDNECVKIDEILSQTRASIEEYKKLKQAVITQAVTKGVRGDRRMKESGIEWIGQVPEEWKVSKAKYCIIIQNGSDPKIDGDIPVFGSGATSFKTCGEYKEGPSVLIGRKGATLHIPHYIETRFWNVDTAFNVYTKSQYCLKYYYYCACSFDYRFYMSQTTLPGMTQQNYENMFLPLPEISEQNEIIEYLDNKCVEIDEVIKKKERIVLALEGYKKALIYECVTGKRGCQN